MAKGNDGHPTQSYPYPRVAGQDRTYFQLGTSKAKPAYGYKEEYEKTMRELYGDQADEIMRIHRVVKESE